LAAWSEEACVEIKSGSTRLVVLVGDKAVKIAKIRLRDPFRRLLGFFFFQRTRRDLLSKYSHAPIKCVGNRIFIGIAANRNEYRYYTSTKDSRVMPVQKQLFGGLVIIQERGLPVTPDEFMKDCLSISGDEIHDMTGIHQFCRRFGTRQIVLIDFGNEETTKFLVATMP
jgi:hypothetical protein